MLIEFIYLLRYQNYTKNLFYCKLDNSEVGVFNTSLLVSEEYGRSVVDSSMYYVTPDEKIYNYQSFAGEFMLWSFFKSYFLELKYCAE